jgi:hypothetical protein
LYAWRSRGQNKLWDACYHWVQNLCLLAYDLKDIKIKNCSSVKGCETLSHKRGKYATVILTLHQLMDSIIRLKHRNYFDNFYEIPDISVHLWLSWVQTHKVYFQTF